MSEAKLKPAAAEFVEFVLQLSPRVAVFDCDGTLWSNNSGEDFFYWSMRNGGPEDGALVSDAVARRMQARYAAYERGEVGEIPMCCEMIAMYKGIPVRAAETAVKIFFAAAVAANIFPEMLALTHQLARQGCELWAISSTNEWLIREGLREFGIPPERILAGRVTEVDGVAGDEVLSMPSDANKATAIRENIRALPDAVFGNSIHDLAMLELARTPVAVNPDPDLEEIARQRKWKIYRPLVPGPAM